MKNTECLPLVFLIMVIGCLPPAAHGKERSTDQVSCYQNGQLIVKTQERIREFLPGESMKLLADINLGQVYEIHHLVYATDPGNVVCVVTTEKR